LKPEPYVLEFDIHVMTPNPFISLLFLFLLVYIIFFKAYKTLNIINIQEMKNNKNTERLTYFFNNGINQMG
jgi:hypothetical protein